jgi:hypothetical protein
LNTFGAAFGTLVAALFFIPNLGNIRTSLLIASLNIAIGVFAILLDRRWSSLASPLEKESPSAEASEAEPLSPMDATSGYLVLLALAVRALSPCFTRLRGRGRLQP